uniref:Uncharacterized protein n=1 Tax=Myotis myotis TaxID=51298 RepID=A0A7J7TTP0_MYOMY|nr:hypothetical protein mMyoMyo1_008932 [Myotis myotis]
MEGEFPEIMCFCYSQAFENTIHLHLLLSKFLRFFFWTNCVIYIQTHNLSTGHVATTGSQRSSHPITQVSFLIFLLTRGVGYFFLVDSSSTWLSATDSCHTCPVGGALGFVCFLSRSPGQLWPQS